MPSTYRKHSQTSCGGGKKENSFSSSKTSTGTVSVLTTTSKSRRGSHHHKKEGSTTTSTGEVEGVSGAVKPSVKRASNCTLADLFALPEVKHPVHPNGKNTTTSSKSRKRESGGRESNKNSPSLTLPHDKEQEESLKNAALGSMRGNSKQNIPLIDLMVGFSSSPSSSTTTTTTTNTTNVEKMNRNVRGVQKRIWKEEEEEEQYSPWEMTSKDLVVSLLAFMWCMVVAENKEENEEEEDTDKWEKKRIEHHPHHPLYSAIHPPCSPSGFSSSSSWRKWVATVMGWMKTFASLPTTTKRTTSTVITSRSYICHLEKEMMTAKRTKKSRTRNNNENKESIPSVEATESLSSPPPPPPPSHAHGDEEGEGKFPVSSLFSSSSSSSLLQTRKEFFLKCLFEVSTWNDMQRVLARYVDTPILIEMCAAVHLLCSNLLSQLCMMKCKCSSAKSPPPGPPLHTAHTSLSRSNGAGKENEKEWEGRQGQVGKREEHRRNEEGQVTEKRIDGLKTRQHEEDRSDNHTSTSNCYTQEEQEINVLAPLSLRTSSIPSPSSPLHHRRAKDCENGPGAAGSGSRSTSSGESSPDSAGGSSGEERLFFPFLTLLSHSFNSSCRSYATSSTSSPLRQCLCSTFILSSYQIFLEALRGVDALLMYEVQVREVSRLSYLEWIQEKTKQEVQEQRGKMGRSGNENGKKEHALHGEPGDESTTTTPTPAATGEVLLSPSSSSWGRGPTSLWEYSLRHLFVEKNILPHEADGAVMDGVRSTSWAVKDLQLSHRGPENCVQNSLPPLSTSTSLHAALLLSADHYPHDASSVSKNSLYGVSASARRVGKNNPNKGSAVASALGMAGRGEFTRGGGSSFDSSCVAAASSSSFVKSKTATAKKGGVIRADGGGRTSAATNRAKRIAPHSSSLISTRKRKRFGRYSSSEEEDEESAFSTSASSSEEEEEEQKPPSKKCKK